MGNRCIIAPSSRQVIADKILSSISEDDMVAIVATKADLNLIIVGLSRAYLQTRRGSKEYKKYVDMLIDLAQLRDAAFGKKKSVTSVPSVPLTKK